MRICSLAVWLALITAVSAAETPENTGGDAAQSPKFDRSATAAEKIKVPPGFRVELLYTVPKSVEGSWVNLCVDPQGRLIVSDQYGDLYRVLVPALGTSGEARVERIPVMLGQAHGLLWAFDSLYVVVNGDGKRYSNGLYRVRDTNGDDQLDSVELLRKIEGGGGEHGPHAVLLTPDKESLFVVCGNNTAPVDGAVSHVPRLWDEDALLPRIYGQGFMRGATPPAGCIYKVDRDGKNWELVASGFRNEFDAALNADGELFTYDADMEWDIGAPWYRPTRVCHVVSGADWGWRVSSAKWPVHYPDTLPAAVDIGLGSPTGIAFGYGARFPAKYQLALYLNDWTYGKMFAVFLEPRGASYGGTFEEFISASPLPLTDTVINPVDGAMYFLIGGRNTQSGLYRVTYVGGESTTPVAPATALAERRAERHALELLHVGEHADAVDKAWPYLGYSDRFLRHAARTALEHRPREEWQQRALNETDPQASLTALLALVRKVHRSYQPPNSADLDTPPPTYPATDAARHPLQSDVLEALGRLDWALLTNEQKLELLRVYALALYRLGPPDEPNRERLIARLDRVYPANDANQDAMLTELLCYLQARSAAAKGTKLLLAAPTQEGQIDLMRSLRFLEAGWTPELRRQLFEWLAAARTFKGGNNLSLFVRELRRDTLDRVPAAEREALRDVIRRSGRGAAMPAVLPPRPFTKDWKMDEVVPLMASGLKGRDFDQGRQMFAAANCFGCHRFANEGGVVGPDLTGLAGRFNARDILESVLEPDRVISDQYATNVVQTADGRVIVGRIVNFSGDDISINTNLLDPTALESVKRQNIEEISNGETSLMPSGLLNTLSQEELLDLMAFLLSRGDRHDAMFSR